MSTISAQSFFSAPRVPGFDEWTQGVFEELVNQWKAKYPRNLERLMYREGYNKLKDLKISIPPEIKDSLEVVMGWPEKTVWEMANRIVLSGISTPDDDPDPFGLRRILIDNEFAAEFPQAVASSLTQSTAFATTTRGGAGDPDAVLQFHTALWSTGLWDRRTRRLRAGLVIGDTDANGSPTEFTVYVPEETLTVRKGAQSWVLMDKVPNRLPRLPMEQIPYRPELIRPFGRSRIDRRVMSLTDRAVRAGARLEVHSELFSAMKLLLLGVGEDAFTDQDGNKLPMWSFYMGRISSLGRDEEGELPQLEKITAESPEPHIAVRRDLTAEFSGHTGVPMSQLGISTDNPESADAKSEARQDIVADAERQQAIFGTKLHRMAENLVMLRDGLTEPPAEMLDLSFDWRNPSRPTVTAMAAAGAQQVTAAPWLAETEVGLELLGLDRQQIERALSEKRRAGASSVLDRIMQQRSGAGGEPAEDAVAEVDADADQPS